MPRKIIKRYLPDHRTVREHKYLKCFGTLLHDPNIWHLNRRSVAGAMAAGLFCSFIPVPFQMFIAAAVAILLRVNLPIAVSMVWITNPITMGPMFYFAYKVGVWILGIPETEFKFELSFDWLVAGLGAVWEPFLLGCFVLGVLCSALGYFIAQAFWRMHIVKYIRMRRERKQRPKTQE